MSRRILVASCIVIALGALFFTREASRVDEGAVTPIPQAPTPAVVAASAATTVQPVEANDGVQAYLAMRDDINPKPRLQYIDAWARAHPDEPGDLLPQAMLDPDEAVRERAAFLFDRAIATLQATGR